MPGGTRGRLRHERDQTRPRSRRRERADRARRRARRDPSPAPGRRSRAAACVFAGAVGPDDAQPLAPLDLERHVARRARRAPTLTPSPTHRIAVLTATVRDVRSTMRKNGAPKNAVTTPIGISAGEITIRARRSASARNAAPNSSDSGRIDAVAATGQQSDGVGNDDADERDEPAHRHGRGRAQRRRHHHDEPRRGSRSRRGSTPRRRRRLSTSSTRRHAMRTALRDHDVGQQNERRRASSPSSAGRGSTRRPRGWCPSFAAARTSAPR